MTRGETAGCEFGCCSREYLWNDQKALRRRNVPHPIVITAIASPIVFNTIHNVVYAVLRTPYPATFSRQESDLALTAAITHALCTHTPESQRATPCCVCRIFPMLKDRDFDAPRLTRGNKSASDTKQQPGQA
ncbi:hypothetical protein BDV59DRAFT_184557 [Aspergillus ambiguus]|uniref:uncharacterized protein n=1 Tax=Aspergillus ambiguus TaxID=176160 RepID=UPI003CCCBDFA